MTKHPLLLQKERYQICINLKRSLQLQKKSVLPQRSPQNDQLFYLIKTTPSYVKKKTVPNCAFIQNALLLQKKQLLPQEAHNR